MSNWGPVWSARATASHLPKSDAKTLTRALREWSYTGQCEDYGEPVETCELCAYHPLRYHFEIENHITNQTMNVGSECITRFGIAGGDAARADRDLMIKRAKEAAIADVIELIKRETGWLDLTEYYVDHGGITPKQAFWAARALHQAGWHRPPSFPPVRLRRHDHQQDLEAMSPRDRGYIWPYLSSAQRKRFSHLDRVAPGPPHP